MDALELRINDKLYQSTGNIIDTLSRKMESVQKAIIDLITSTTGTIESYIQTIILSNGTVEDSKIHNLLISDTVTSIMKYYSYFATGKFDALLAELNGQKMIELSQKLYNLKSNLPSTSNYEMIRNIIVSSFEALMQIINKNIQHLSAQNAYASALEKANILDDVKKLEEYIKKLNQTTAVRIIPDVLVETPLMKFSPEIEKYIQLHGFPPNGVFDPDLLGAIVI
jgi:hypothetical protein